MLPGTLQAYYDAQIYSRVPGYVHAWYKDIGAHVKKGDVLATIDTPELDQQISQARADLGAAQCGAETCPPSPPSAGTACCRWMRSPSRMRRKRTTIWPARPARPRRPRPISTGLQAMKGFAQIVAPFDGVVTKRTADIGALVNAGPGRPAAIPLFAVSDYPCPARLMSNVPQSYSAQIVPGMTVSLTVPEYPGTSISGQAGFDLQRHQRTSPRPCWWNSRPTIPPACSSRAIMPQVSMGMPRGSARVCAFPPAR